MNRVLDRGRQASVAALWLVLFLPISVQGAIPSSERDALISLYNATSGPNWTNRTNWLGVAGTECSWFGVVCDSTQTGVISLFLGNNNLTGSIAPQIVNLSRLQKLYLPTNKLSSSISAELARLSELQELALHTNELSGPIPSQLGDLQNLKWLLLGLNRLSGGIPSELGKLGNLERLYVDSNQLTGEIPPVLGNLTNLQELSFYSNQLTGVIPPQLGNLLNLKQLVLSRNQLSGEVPPGLDKLTKLENLNLLGNQLGGAIPPELANLANLKFLFLAENRLTGGIPPELGLLTKLEQLHLYVNQLTGSVPPQLGNLQNLKILSLSANRFSGGIPSELGKLTKLEKFHLGTNQFTGVIPAELGNLANLQEISLYSNQLTGGIPPQLGDLVNLRILTLGENRLSGEIPPLGRLINLEELQVLGNQLSGSIQQFENLLNLKRLVLGRNQLSGEIPPGLGRLTKLEELNLFANQLGGAIPRELANLENLRFLVLGENRLIGGIPPELGRLTKLEQLHLYLNQLTGGIPKELANLSNLQELNLYSNRLSGTIPPELGNLTNLRRILSLARNQLVGAIPPELGKLTKLETLQLYENQLSGGIPVELSGLVSLEALVLFRNQLTGSVPSQLGNLQNLKTLSLSANGLSGGIPSELGKLTKLEKFQLGVNQFTGVIPAELGNLANLQEISLYSNQLTGDISPQLGNLVNLRILVLGANRLSGQIPSNFGRLTNLQELNLWANQLSGRIPPELGKLTKLQKLGLDSNQLSGPVPPEIGDLVGLNSLGLSANQLSGSLPSQLSKLVALQPGALDLAFNALYTGDRALRDFLNTRQKGGDWEKSQTIAPTDLSVTSAGSTATVLTWRPISLSSGNGGYQIGVATAPRGPFTIHVTTASKSISAAIVKELSPSTSYYFAVRSVAYPHGALTSLNRQYQQNIVLSEFTSSVPATTTPPAPTPAEVVVFSPPGGMVQEPGKSGATDRYILTNIGREATSIRLSQTGDFYTQGPTSFTLNPGANQTVFLSALARPADAYAGSSIPTGVGVREGLSIPVRLLVANLVTGIVIAEALASRVDVNAPPEQNPRGSAEFRNDGNDTLVGMLVADVDWIVPQSGLITIRPGQTLTVSFTVDRRKRPDASAPAGALTASLFLIYPKTQQGMKAFLSWPFQVDNPPPGIGKSTVTVVDTVKPPVSPSAVPALLPNEVALFVPGVGRVAGSVGLFLSDISIINSFGADSLRDLRIFYTGLAAAGSSVATVPPVAPSSTLSFADVVKSVFDTDGQIGSLQIRGSNLDRISVNASIFNVSSRAGTFGTVIPVFRSDRAIAAGERLFLTGLRSGSNTHTNIFVQETSGFPATARIESFNAEGVRLANRTENLGPFGLVRLLEVVPVGAASATVTNQTGSAGRIVAYATPVDRLSGDFWSVNDWSRHFDADRADPVVIPVAGTLRGANNTFFRTDLAVMNTATTTESGVLRYYRNSAEVLERTITLNGGQTQLFDDVIGSQFGAVDSIGHLVFTPSCPDIDPELGTSQPCSALFAATSRTFATVAGLPGTYGTGVPAIGLPFALRLGQSRLIGGIQDIPSTRGTPGTFRTNVELVETAGASVTVRVTLLQTDAKSLVALTTSVSKEITLQPRQFLLFNLGNEILGSDHADIRNAQALFEIIDGEGAIMVVTSSVDNGTGDTILRID